MLLLALRSLSRDLVMMVMVMVMKFLVKSDVLAFHLRNT